MHATAVWHFIADDPLDAVAGQRCHAATRIHKPLRRPLSLSGWGRRGAYIILAWGSSLFLLRGARSASSASRHALKILRFEQWSQLIITGCILVAPRMFSTRFTGKERNVGRTHCASRPA